MEAMSDIDNNMRDLIDDFLSKSNFAQEYRESGYTRKRININIDKVREFDQKLSKYLISNPSKAILLLKSRVMKMIEDINGSIDTQKQRQFGDSMFPTKTEDIKINIEGNLGANFVTPRGLKSSMLNKLVRVQGIVTRMSIVKPKLKKSYHYAPATKTGFVQEYKDQYSIEGQGEYSTKMFPTKDAQGNILSPEFGY